MPGYSVLLLLSSATIPHKQTAQMTDVPMMPEPTIIPYSTPTSLVATLLWPLLKLSGNRTVRKYHVNNPNAIWIKTVLFNFMVVHIQSWK
jgi:hypothetical protein